MRSHPVIDTARLVLGPTAPFVAFLDRCFTSDVYISTVQQLAPGPVQTLYSRFARAGLPTPADYLAEARLVRLRERLDHEELTIVAAAQAMGYSSGTALTRHVRLRRGMSGVEWRAQSTAHGERERFRDTLILPFVEAQRAFRAQWILGLQEPRSRIEVKADRDLQPLAWLDLYINRPRAMDTPRC